MANTAHAHSAVMTWTRIVDLHREALYRESGVAFVERPTRLRRWLRRSLASIRREAHRRFRRV